MRTITIVRDERRDSPDGWAWEGRLFLDGLLVGPTLEREMVMIAPGSYEIRHHTSDGHPHSIQIMVPHRNWILIHSGGRPAHSEGCVLLGKNDLDGAAISGGAPIVQWLYDQADVTKYPADTDDHIPSWLCVVCQIGGDIADGVVT